MVAQPRLYFERNVAQKDQEPSSLRMNFGISDQSCSVNPNHNKVHCSVNPNSVLSTQYSALSTHACLSTGSFYAISTHIRWSFFGHLTLGQWNLVCIWRNPRSCFSLGPRLRLPEGTRSGISLPSALHAISTDTSPQPAAIHFS